MDDKLREQLEQQLYAKMKQEHRAYLAGVKTWPADEIIQSAYQIAWRENLLYLMEGSTGLTARQLRTLLEMETPMGELYERWLGQDTQELDLIRGCMENEADSVLNHQAKKAYSDPQTPLYDKNFDEARAADELYEWKADHLRNCACNQAFRQKAEDAHHNGALQAFLREWVDIYGLNRCMFVLSCTMARREGDGRFYPPARQAAARFTAQRVQREDHLTRYVNDVHSGIVNLAMEGLVNLELAQKHEKPHEPRKNRMER